MKNSIKSNLLKYKVFKNGPNFSIRKERELILFHIWLGNANHKNRKKQRQNNRINRTPLHQSFFVNQYIMGIIRFYCEFLGSIIVAKKGGAFFAKSTKI